MKNLFLFAGLFMALLITSCSKDGVNDSDESNSQEVVFQVSNFTTSTSRSAQNLNKAADNEIPECSDVEAAMVKLTILDASDLATEYTLSLVGINNKTETEPLKLDAGNYRITSFVAYAQDGTTAVWAAPMMGSYYQTLWDLKGVNELPFIVAAFDQVNVEVDVLCYEPHDYQNFGFAWFAFSQTKINTICFFGDICTEFYEQWHTLEGSPYVGQTNNRSSFPAIFSVEVYNEAGVLVNDPDLNSNISWQGTGAPLCIEYPNQIGVDETFSFTISVALPDGKKEEIYNGTFEDTAVASTAGEGGFGGKDGVFTFGAGCTNQGNDVNVTLSKYDFSALQPAPLAIGDFHEGGIIFYLAPEPTDLNGDGILDTGLVCALEDQSTSIQWFNGQNVITGATGTAIGTGSANTTAIIGVQGDNKTNYAAGLASVYSGGGYSDWFLPSKDELHQMVLNYRVINSTSTNPEVGGSIFSSNNYLSSSEVNYQTVWYENLPGQQIMFPKHGEIAVRSIRAF